MANVLIDLATPTGWDAAVACLARRYWPDMEPTDRAEFFHLVGAGGGWCLRWRGLRAISGGWPDPADVPDPVAALRAVLLHEAGRS